MEACRVPRFVPFRALRYADRRPRRARSRRRTTCSPTPRSTRCRARREHNITRVDVPRGGADRYASGRDLLADWRADGVLVADDRPSFTIYRMRFTDATGTARDIAGVLGGLEVVDEGAGGVLPHERTTPKASTDRLDLTRATRANLSPVWGLSLATGLTELLAEPGEPLGAVTDDGVEHLVERVTDPDRIAAIQRGAGRRRRADRRRAPPVRRSAGPTATRSGQRPAAPTRRPSRPWPSSTSWSPTSSASRRSTGSTTGSYAELSQR